MKAGPIDWFETTLGDSFQTVTGNTPPKSKIDLYGEAIPLVKPPELIDGEVATATDGLSEKGLKFARVAPIGSTLVSCIGNLGKIGLTTAEVAFNQQINAIFPAPDIAIPEFVYYLTLSPQFRGQLLALSSGTTVPIVNKGRFNSIKLLLPPINVQKRIVAVLDQAFVALDRARAHAEANLADAEELLENSLNEVFRELATTASVLRLEDAVHPDCKLSYGIVQPGDDVEDGLPVVRPVDLKQRVVTLAGLKRISADRAEGYARTKLVGGELLLCVRGSTGEVSMAAPQLAGGNVTRGIVPIRFEDDRVLREFAYFQFRSRFVRDQIAAKTYGAALMQINIKDLRQLHLVVPPISQQRAAVERAESLYARSHKLRDAYAKKLADIANLRQSLLQKAFSGELT